MEGRGPLEVQGSGGERATRGTGEWRGEGLCQGLTPDISQVESRHIEQKSLFLKNTMANSPDSKFHMFAKVSLVLR